MEKKREQQTILSLQLNPGERSVLPQKLCSPHKAFLLEELQGLVKLQSLLDFFILDFLAK